MSDLPLPLDLPAPPTCWYCATTQGPLEREHQLPRSRGGHRGPVVNACARCNDLKGPLDVEEFREGLAERLGVSPADVVFAGEATAERPMTPRIGTVRSLTANRSVTRLDPAVGEQLSQAWRWMRITLDPTITRRDIASQAISRYLTELQEQLVDGTEWPDPEPALFDVTPAPPPTGRRELSRLPRVRQSRDTTKVAGDLLTWARAGVEHRRRHGEPDLTLLDWVNAAFSAALAADTERYPSYPTLDQAIDHAYGTPS